MNEYQPDADASGLDRAVMTLAQQMHDAGWVDEAVEIGSAMAEIREAARNPNDYTGGRPAAIFDQLFTVSGSASRIAMLIEQCYPDEFALKDS